MSDQNVVGNAEAVAGETSLTDRIRDLINNADNEGEYITVRTAARSLNVKQVEIRDALPDGFQLEAPGNGGLAESKIVLTSAGTSPTVSEENSQEVPTEGEDVTIAEALAETESGPTVICAICGNPVRKSTIVRRGICPLCFRTLAQNVKMTTPKLEAMSDEEFDVVLGNELGRRQKLVDYKTSRTLTKEQFEAFDPKLIPVKEVFAAGKEKGYGPGRVAQAMGGDRFRHEPVGGFGSVWTPYFYGARNAWYFDPAILESFDDLKKPEKPVVEKKTRTAKDPTASRTGVRGAKMTPVPATSVDEGEGTPADADTAEMAATPA